MSTSLHKLAWFKSVLRALFSYFDATKCRWETEKDSCDDYVTDSDVTFSGDTDSDTDSDTNVEDSPNTDTNVIDETSNDDVTHVIDTSDDDTSVTDTDMDTNNDVTDVTTEKPFYQNLECEPLDETWMCSSGSKNHSLCIKFCTIGSDLSNFPVM